MTEPTPDELAEMIDMSDDLAPARGICIGMLIGAALWAVIIIGYFTFF